MSKKKILQQEYLSDRELAILGTFVFFPMKGTMAGRRGPDIVRVAKPVFRRLYRGYAENVWLMQVSLTCKKLTQRGFLSRVGFVTKEFRNYSHERREKKYPGSTEPAFDLIKYDSPLFALSEAGFSYVLANMNMDELPSVDKAVKLWMRPYDNHEVLDAFKLFVFGDVNADRQRVESQDYSF